MSHQVIFPSAFDVTWGHVVSPTPISVSLVTWLPLNRVPLNKFLHSQAVEMVGSGLAQGKAAKGGGTTLGSLPDLNPLENLWKVLQQGLWNVDRAPASSSWRAGRAAEIGMGKCSVGYAEASGRSGTPKRVSNFAALRVEHIGMSWEKNGDLFCVLLAYDRCKRTFRTPCRT